MTCELTTRALAGDSPIRLIDDIDPVKGASNPNLNCGQGAALAAVVDDAAADA